MEIPEWLPFEEITSLLVQGIWIQCRSGSFEVENGWWNATGTDDMGYVGPVSMLGAVSW